MKDAKITTDRRTGPLLMVVIAAGLWASSGLWIGMALARSGISPAALAFWRDAATFAVLLTGLAVWRPRLLRVQRRDLPALAGMGVFSIGIFHVLWNLSVLADGIALATVLQYLSTVLVPLAAWVLWREPLTRYLIVAAVLALAGILLMAGLSGAESGGNVQLTTQGIIIGIVSACGYGSMSLFGKSLTGRYNPWTVLTYAFGFGAFTLLIWQLATGGPEPLPSVTWPPFAALVFLPTVSGFGLYTIALRRLRAGVAAIAAATEMLFAAILAYAFAGERLGAGQIAGALLIVGGVVLLAMVSNVQVRANNAILGQRLWHRQRTLTRDID